MRTCVRCKTDLPTSEFYLRDGRPRGRICKACDRAARQRWYEHNTERQKATNLAWAARNADRVKEIKRGDRDRNVETIRARNRAYYEATKETKALSRWRSWLKYNHGITPERYLELLDAQGGSCAICGDGVNGTRRYRLHIDHDHRCCDTKPPCGNCIRGLLCNRCNAALGRFDDDPQLLLQAYNYLTSPRLGQLD